MRGEPSRTERAAELEHLRARLAEAEEVLRAIHDGDVDAVVVSGERGEQVYTLSGADRIYRQLIETMSEGAATVSAKGVILYRNVHLAGVLGRPLEQVLGTALRNYLAPADRQALDAVLAQARTGPSRREMNVESGEGRLVPVYVSASPLQTEGAEMVFCLVLTDLTEQKRLEHIVAAERLARSILEQAAEAIVVCDELGRIIRTSQAARQLCDSSALLARFAEAFPLRTAASEPFQIAPVLRGETLRNVDVVLARPGQKHHLILNAGPLLSGQQVLGCVVTLTDVTERKLAEASLRTAEEKFRGLVEQAIAGIFIIQDGKFVYVNPRAAELAGKGSAGELIGTDVLHWVVEADRRTVAENMRQLLVGETQNVALDFRALREDGVTIQIGANAACATHEGRPAIIGLLRDISEKKRADEEILRYIARLKTAFMSTVEVATTISEMRDPYTAGHERRVAQIAVAIGAELGLDEHRQEGLSIAGHLHDVGKVSIPAEILSKAGKLSAIEFQLIRGHAQAGYDVLKAVEFPWPVAQVALQHHERIDGSGYPQGLKGEAILLEARIMAVADVVEAMSSHRPYRPGLGIDKALAEIERGRGTAYDSQVADACLRLFRERGYECSPS